MREIKFFCIFVISLFFIPNFIAKSDIYQDRFIHLQGNEIEEKMYNSFSPIKQNILSFIFSMLSYHVKKSMNLYDIDQSQEKRDGYVEVYGDKYFAQSFVPQTYGKMTGLELLISRKGIARKGYTFSLLFKHNQFNGKLIVSVYKKLEKLSLQDRLATAYLDPWDIQKSEGWVYVSFGEGFKVRLGGTYYIVVHQEGGDENNYYRWYYGTGNPYELGSSFSEEGYISGEDWQEDKDKDFCFRTYGEYSGEEPDGVVERWAVIIGVVENLYGEICYYADQDAYDMRNVLVNHGWQSSHIKVLISPTGSEISEAMDWMSSMDDPDDISLLSWTAHGTVHGIIPRDGGILSYSAIGNMLDELDAQGIVVIANNCNSGAAIPYLEKNGRVIITACKSSEASSPNDDLQNSVFIYFLADETGTWSKKWGWPTPLEGKDGAFARDDPDTNEKDYGGNNDGWVSAEEAFNYAYRWDTNTGVHPQISDMYSGDLNIARRG